LARYFNNLRRAVSERIRERVVKPDAIRRGKQALLASKSNSENVANKLVPQSNRLKRAPASAACRRLVFCAHPSASQASAAFGADPETLTLPPLTKHHEITWGRFPNLGNATQHYRLVNRAGHATVMAPVWS